MIKKIIIFSLLIILGVQLCNAQSITYPKIKPGKQYAVKPYPMINPNSGTIHVVAFYEGNNHPNEEGKMYIGINNKVDTFEFLGFCGNAHIPKNRIPKGKIRVRVEMKDYLPFDDSIPVKGPSMISVFIKQKDEE